MDNKKLIAGFGYQEGRISSWDGKRTYTQAVPQMAKHCCDNGVDEILVYDWSVRKHRYDQRGFGPLWKRENLRLSANRRIY